jgi:hypothetical protein
VKESGGNRKEGERYNVVSKEAAHLRRVTRRRDAVEMIGKEAIVTYEQSEVLSTGL